MRTKKETERHILKKFISNERLQFRIASIQDNETPDFIITTFEGKKVSIELTGLIDPNLKSQEEFQTYIVTRAQEMFNEKHHVNLEVHVTFSANQIKCRRSEIDEFSSLIFQLVDSVYAPLQEFEFRASSRHSKNLGKYIDSIFISNEFDFANWQTFGAFLVDRVDFNLVKEAVTIKEAKIKKYKEKFDENWLILTSTFGTKSSAYDFEYVNFSKLETKFDKVYAYKYFEDAVVEIK